jgi:CHAD domain-containing protein
VSPRGNLLDESVERAARVIALDLLGNASKHRARLGNKRNTEALHDFRVGVRRLRSWLRAFEPWLEGSVPRRARRRLSKAARATNASRDADVRLIWLRAQRNELKPAERPGLAWLIKQISDDREKTFEAHVAQAARAFVRAQGKLDRTLRKYRVTIVDDDEDALPSFSVVMGQLIRDHASDLSDRLRQIHAIRNTRQIHVARIAAKRLRYLMNPLEEIVPGVRELDAELGKLQDALGDSHDVTSFARDLADLLRDLPAEDEKLAPGMSAIRLRLRARAAETFAAVQAWLDGGAKALIERVTTIADALSPQLRPALTLVQEQSSA